MDSSSETEKIPSDSNVNDIDNIIQPCGKSGENQSKKPKKKLGKNERHRQREQKNQSKGDSPDTTSINTSDTGESNKSNMMKNPKENNKTDDSGLSSSSSSPPQPSSTEPLWKLPTSTIPPEIKNQIEKNSRKQVGIMKEIENMERQRDLINESIRVKKNFYSILGISILSNS